MVINLKLLEYSIEFFSKLPHRKVHEIWEENFFRIIDAFRDKKYLQKMSAYHFDYLLHLL